MGEFAARVGDKLYLRAQLEDGATNKFVRAYVVDQDSNALPGSPFTLIHKQFGKYTYSDAALTFPDVDEVSAQYVVFNDAAFTQLDEGRGISLSVWQKSHEVDIALDEVRDKVCQILNIVAGLSASADLYAVVEAVGHIDGYVEVLELTGIVEDFELIGTIHSEDELIAIIETNSEIVGFIAEEG